LVKIKNIQLLHDYELANTPEIIAHVKSVYIHKTNFSLLTKIDMEKINSAKLTDNSSQIKKLYED